jgi:tetratricopeptide (TPR) repeat protein
MKSRRAGIEKSFRALALTAGLVLGSTVSHAGNPPPSTFTPPVLNMPFPGQLSSRFRIDDSDPEGSVPSHAERDKSPLEYGYYIQDLLERAAQAEKTQNDQGAIAYYRALVKAVPERAKSWGKLCEAYERVNDHERAAAACGTALLRPGVEVQDYVRFVHATIESADAKGAPLTAQERTQLSQVLEHLDQQPSVQILASHLRCEVGVKEGDPRQLETCTGVLAKLAPNDPKTAIFQWTLAVQRGQRDRAGDILNRLKKLGLPQENLDRMEAVTFPNGRSTWRWWALIAFAAIGGGAVAIGVRRRRTAAVAV